MKSRKFAKAVRRLVLQMVTRAKASHVGSALSIADIIAVLYTDVLRVNPIQPAMLNRDRFILSKGHACVALYGALAEKGFFMNFIRMLFFYEFTHFIIVVKEVTAFW